MITAERAKALARLEKHHLHLSIVDLSLDGEDGPALVADLRQRGIPVLVYSMHKDPHHVQAAIAAGALGIRTAPARHRLFAEVCRIVFFAISS